MAQTEGGLAQAEGFGQPNRRDGNVAQGTLAANDIASLLKCSTRHVWRLRDGGMMPPPVKLGALIRWPTAVITRWIEDGCPKVRKAVRS